MSPALSVSPLPDRSAPPAQERKTATMTFSKEESVGHQACVGVSLSCGRSGNGTGIRFLLDIFSSAQEEGDSPTVFFGGGIYSFI